MSFGNSVLDFVRGLCLIVIVGSYSNRSSIEVELGLKASVSESRALSKHFQAKTPSLGSTFLKGSLIVSLLTCARCASLLPLLIMVLTSDLCQLRQKACLYPA